MPLSSLQNRLGYLILLCQLAGIRSGTLMSSRNTDSLAASWRSQSQICRWISGSVLRRRSARGGKSPPRSARAGSLLPLLPFLPHQEAVGQHHRHRVPVEASPPSALVLVPAQEPLGLLVVLLHPVPPMRVLHHRLQRHPRPEVAPVIPTLRRCS